MGRGFKGPQQVQSITPVGGDGLIVKARNVRGTKTITVILIN